MGTYTTNYQLYMPTVGETGWGTLINGNFLTIDTTMKGLNTRLTAVENEVNGNLSCTSVTTSGKITGNGGIAGTTGTFSGAVTGASGTFTGIVDASNVGILGIPYQLILSNSRIDIDGLACDYYQNSYSVGYSHGYSIFYNSVYLAANGTITKPATINISKSLPWYIKQINNKSGAWLFQLNTPSSNKAIVNGINVPAGSTVNITQAQALDLLSKQASVTLTNPHPGQQACNVTFYIKNNGSDVQYITCVPVGLAL